MPLVKGTGKEAILPQVTAPSVQPIDRLRVTIMRTTHGTGKRIIIPGGGEEMDVIGHQAVAVNVQAVFPRLLKQDAKVEMTIIGGEEDVLSIVAALSYVMRQTGNDDTGNPRHGSILAPPAQASSKW